MPPSDRSQAPPPRTPAPAAAAASGYEGLSRYASEPLPRELQSMGDVFPDKTRGARAEKRPYVPERAPLVLWKRVDVRLRRHGARPRRPGLRQPSARWCRLPRSALGRGRIPVRYVSRHPYDPGAQKLCLGPQKYSRYERAIGNLSGPPASYFWAPESRAQPSGRFNMSTGFSRSSNVGRRASSSGWLRTAGWASHGRACH